MFKRFTVERQVEFFEEKKNKNFEIFLKLRKTKIE
jgi:hypothetical protein